MPVYEYNCPEGHSFERYLKLANYDEPQVCLMCGGLGVKVPQVPHLAIDTFEYVSPRTGKLIRGRLQRREDLLVSECVEWEPGFKEECERKARALEREEEAKLDALIDREIEALPARKRESLAGEMEAGLDVAFERKGI